MIDRAAWLRVREALRPPAPALAGQMPGYRSLVGVKRRWVRVAGMTALVVTSFFYIALMLLLPPALMIPLGVPILVLALLIVWALPVANVYPARATETLYWILFGSLFLWPYYLALVIPGLPWITVSRLFGAPLIVMLVYYASRSRPFRTEMATLISGAPAIVHLVTAFTILQIISMGFAEWPLSVFNKVFNNLITWTGLFFAGLWAMRDEHGVLRWGRLFVVYTAILGVLAIAEAQVGHVLWSQAIPSFFQIEDGFTQEVLQGFYRLDGSYRVITTATTPLSFGELLALAIPFVLLLVDRNPNPKTIAFALVVEALVFHGALQADARLSFVGMLIAHFTYFALFALAYKRTNPKSLLATTLVMIFPLAVMAATAAVLFVGRVRKHVLGSGQHQWSDNARGEQWAMGMVKFQESPLFGFGASQGGPELGYYTPGGKLTIDSYYLSILLDYGLIGVVIFYGLMVYATVRCVGIAIRRRDDIGKLATALAAFLTVSFVIKSVLSQEANQPLLFMALAAVVIVCLRDRQTRDQAMPARPLRVR